MSDFNDDIIAAFRANGGRVDSAFGTDLVLLHSSGARTGRPRVTPALSVRDGGDWLIVGSAKGAAADPAWVHNLRAHNDVRIEAHTGDQAETVAVTAAELAGVERETAFARFVERAPAFASYRRRAAPTRILPVFRLSRSAPESKSDSLG